MQDDVAMLQCPNEFCKALNCQTDKFCQQCGMPLIKRYLWAVGEEAEAEQLGNFVANRYLLKSNRVFLDTKPGLPPEMPDSEIPDRIKPYLRLIPYRLHVPQVYGLVSLGKGRTSTEILLLEEAPIYPDAVPLAGQLMPELTEVWKGASSMRQLNWLWQIAQLWQPLSTEGVGSSLLDLQLLRVEGSLIRLLELRSDQGFAPRLSQLGQVWSQLAAGARPSIAEFLEQLCLYLRQGEVQSVEKLVTVLEQGLSELGRSLLPSTFKIATRTDKGPSRQRNEDACYPPSGTVTTIQAKESNLSPALAIVCDGIGGHQGGNIASNLAIETIEQHIQQLALDDDRLNSTTLSSELELSAHAANNRISQRNDNEHRYGRQRMGTTLVMALGRDHEIYITDVGDSRAYRITRIGCHQITLDDDVATREVRLGYSLYRDALQQASSGSLVQALGMSSSASSLHPTVQRFILDEDCVFLLCSDGLSDYDLLDQCWETEILPVLEGKMDVDTAGARLVEIANTRNGHDNVTVGLVYCQVTSFEPELKLSLSLAALDTVSSAANSPAAATVLQDTNTLEYSSNSDFSTLNTQLLPSEHTSRRFLLPMLLGLVLLVSLGGGLLAYLSKQGKLPRLISGSSNSIAEQSAKSSTSPALKKPIPGVPPFSYLEKGSLLQTKSEIVLSSIPKRQSEAIASQPRQRFGSIKGILPAGSVLQVLDKRPIPEPDYWLNLKVCSMPSTTQAGAIKPVPNKNGSDPTAFNSRLLQPKDEGWIRETDIESYYLPISSLESAQRVNCPTPASSTPLPELGAPMPSKPAKVGVEG